MKFENTYVGNIDGAMRGMRFPMKSVGDTVGDIIGEADMKLATKLWTASKNENLAHSKFLRQIFVSVDITAPLYIWSEFDQYKIGTVTNSESTMHRLIKDSKGLRPIDFECDDENIDYIWDVILHMQNIVDNPDYDSIKKLRLLKQILPTSFLQKRHWTGNYEIIRNAYRQRKIFPHRLTEWTEIFASWAESLPYAENFITRRE